MLSKVDKLILGGGMVFTFLKARGVNVGASLVEDDQLDLARKLEKIAAEKGVKLYLASDICVADKFAADANNKIVDVNAIPEGWMGLDIGPKTIEELKGALSDCKVITTTPCYLVQPPQPHYYYHHCRHRPLNTTFFSFISLYHHLYSRFLPLDRDLERSYGCVRNGCLRQGNQRHRHHPRRPHRQGQYITII